MNELISVIVPAYNVSAYLENCINSILNQTYSDIEIIVVNDGSTDCSGKIADQYAYLFPGKIKSIHQKNSGVTAARIKGVLESSGKWIGFVDADDEVEPDMYERLIHNAVKYNADISHCGHKTIVNGGERIHYFHNTGKLSVQNRKTSIKELLTGHFEPGLWTKIYKRSIVFEIIKEHIIDQSIQYNEDLLMNYYLFSKSCTSVLEDFCGYRYMARVGSATRDSFRIERVIDPYRVSKIILHSIDHELNSVALRNLLMCCMNAFIAIYNLKEFNEYRVELKQELISNIKNLKVLYLREKIKMLGILTWPWMFIRVYRLYEKKLQPKVYE